MRRISNVVLVMLSAFVIALVVEMTIFAVDWEAFHSLINFCWANEFDKALILSGGGVLLLIITVMMVIGTIFIQIRMPQWMYLSYLLAVIAGVLMEILIVGAYTKIVW